MTGWAVSFQLSLAGSIFKFLQRKRQQHNSNKATGHNIPSLLAVASPNKTWVGVTGAIFLGTTTAVALEGSLRRLASGPLSQLGVGLPGDLSAGVFSIGTMGWQGLSAAGVAICVVGVVGDLWESLLKRTAMVKVREHWRQQALSCVFLNGFDCCRESTSSALRASNLVFFLCSLRPCLDASCVVYMFCCFDGRGCVTPVPLFVGFRVGVARRIAWPPLHQSSTITLRSSHALLFFSGAHIQDSGMIFPGHGGCLDRLDGVLAAAPLYLAIVEMFEATAVDEA